MSLKQCIDACVLILVYDCLHAKHACLLDGRHIVDMEHNCVCCSCSYFFLTLGDNSARLQYVVHNKTEGLKSPLLGDSFVVSCFWVNCDAYHQSIIGSAFRPASLIKVIDADRRNGRNMPTAAASRRLSVVDDELIVITCTCCWCCYLLNCFCVLAAGHYCRFGSTLLAQVINDFVPSD
jgi:hypothetical protein